jgi:hypothetical protein
MRWYKRGSHAQLLLAAKTKQKGRAICAIGTTTAKAKVSAVGSIHSFIHFIAPSPSQPPSFCSPKSDFVQPLLTRTQPVFKKLCLSNWVNLSDWAVPNFVLLYSESNVNRIGANASDQQIRVFPKPKATWPDWRRPHRGHRRRRCQSDGI